ADGGDGGTSTGNGGSGGGGAGGTIFLSAAQITLDGNLSASGGIGGAVGQANATSGGGDGGVGIIVLRDSDGIIAGAGAGTPNFILQGTLPTGLMLNAATGEISGTAPTVRESTIFNIIVEDSTVNNSQYDTITYRLNASGDADLAISKTDGLTTTRTGSTSTY